MSCGGDFVIYEIWEAISLSKVVIWGFSIDINTWIHHHLSSYFSECGLVGHLQRLVGLFQPSFSSSSNL